MKITVRLSDGSIAKKGMYITIIEGRCLGHSAGQTTRILQSCADGYKQNPNIISTVFEKSVIDGNRYLEYKYDSRKATPAEKKAYIKCWKS